MSQDSAAESQLLVGWYSLVSTVHSVSPSILDELTDEADVADVGEEVCAVRLGQQGRAEPARPEDAGGGLGLGLGPGERPDERLLARVPHHAVQGVRHGVHGVH